MRTSRVAFVLALALLATLSAGAASAQSGAAPSFSGPERIAAAQDFASSAYADPWDYANREDLILDRGPTQNLTNKRFESGMLKFSASQPGYVSLLFPGYHGALPFGRDGVVQPIDASYYTHAAVRMYSSANMGGALFWDRCYRSYTDVCRGEYQWPVKAGWQTYVLPLRDLTRNTQTYDWEGRVSALRLAVGPNGSERFAVDWVRLYRPGANADVDVAWTNPSPGSRATLYWDHDADPGNNTAGNAGWGVVGTSTASSGTTAFPAAAFPPGDYYFSTEANGRRSAVSRRLHIDAPPLIEILDPDEKGGEDYATVHLRNPWDFNQRSDVSSWGNATNVAFSGGAMHANNGGPTMNDPFVWLKVGRGGIDSSRYHRMTIDFDYDGPFALEDVAGGGTHGRVVWFRNGNKAATLESKEIVTYSGRRSYTFDLTTNPVGAVMEDDRPSRAGWPGARVTSLRWDPNEDRGARRWRIHDIKLRADDETRENTFTISWRDRAHQPGTTVSLYYDTDQTGGNGKLIAADIPQNAGTNRFRWWTGDLAPGRYYVYAIADDGVSTHRAYSSGPLRVRASSAPSPYARFNPWKAAGATAASAPASVSWASNRTDLFAVDDDGRLVHRYHQSGKGWGPRGWEDLGRPAGLTLLGQPAVSSQEPGSLDVFVRGSDHAIWQKYYRLGRGWSRWHSLGGVLATSPTTVFREPGHVDVLATSPNGKVYLRTWHGRWGAWRSIGGPMASAPGVTSWGPGRLDIFARGTDGTLQHRWYDNGRWGPWASRGGVLVGDGRPSAVSWADGRIDVFVIGGNGLYHQAYQSGWGWLPGGRSYDSLWSPDSDVELISGTAANSRRRGHIEAYVTDTEGRIWTRTAQG